MNASPLSKRHILVVDDEPLVCETVTMLLQGDGHLVESTNDVNEALALFEPGKFDLVITDFFMPIMMGDQLAQAIKAQDPDQRVLMLSAFPEKLRSRDRSLAYVDSCLSKPLELDDLRNAITSLNLPA